MAEEVTDAWLVSVSVSPFEKILDDSRGCEILQPAGIVEERTAIQSSGGFEEHPPILDTVSMFASLHALQ